MKRGVWSALFLLILSGATYVGYRSYSHDRFRIAGVISLDPALEWRAKRPNTVLFLVAKNHGGIPVAVKKIINPQFPLHFDMGPEDLLLPGYVWTGPLSIEAVVNTHGHAGMVLPGDMTGSCPTSVASGAQAIFITVNKTARSSPRT